MTFYQICHRFCHRNFFTENLNDFFLWTTSFAPSKDLWVHRKCTTCLMFPLELPGHCCLPREGEFSASRGRRPLFATTLRSWNIEWPNDSWWLSSGLRRESKRFVLLLRDPQHVQAFGLLCSADLPSFWQTRNQHPVFGWEVRPIWWEGSKEVSFAGWALCLSRNLPCWFFGPSSYLRSIDPTQRFQHGCMIILPQFTSHSECTTIRM